VKIAIFSVPELNPGKHNIKDERLDAVHKITQSAKKTYIQVELVGEDTIRDADVILAQADMRTDLILKDLEFLETRLGRSEDEQEKALLNKLKAVLEKEEFVSRAGLSDEEKKLILVYGLLTNKQIVLAGKDEIQNSDTLLPRAIKESGYISFFTTGEKETRSWLIKQGTTAWEAAGVIHSDIQRGFIRAEIISLADFIALGGENQAKQAGKMRLEAKDYVMQDADLTNFRFNK
jgi:ribosome-binding ATPase YchF (GTP1/OBG family)